MVEGDPIVIAGGGAAGILSAWKAASLGAQVVLLERNKKLGIKLLISGGGKCNITHAGTNDELLSAFAQREARFLKYSMYQFSNADIVRMIEEEGVKTFVRPNGRVFPLSSRADDVVDALSTWMKRSGVDVRLNARVDSLVTKLGKVHGVVVRGQTVPTQWVVLATGGASYPRTGTTGDGFQWAKAAGHTIVHVRPALAPIGVTPRLPSQWSGVAVRGGCLSIHLAGRRLLEWKDDILFTHEGLSGPAALELSRSAAEAATHGAVEVKLDFFPAMDFSSLDLELNKAVLDHRGKMIASILEAWLPNRIVPYLLQSKGIDPAKRGHVLTREERRMTVHVLKSWTIGRVSHIDMERGEVTAGGVALDEVDPRTMRSRKVRGLYVCGEVLDIAGPVGGYNLQAAFSTGVVAGASAAEDWLSSSDVPGNHHAGISVHLPGALS